MSTIEAPLGGDVAQVFSQAISQMVEQNLRLWFLPFQGMQIQLGLINVAGRSSAPDLERAVVNDVASYGRQLGRAQDALAILLAHLPAPEELSKKEREAIADFKQMFNNIAEVKRQMTDKEVLSFTDDPKAKLVLR